LPANLLDFVRSNAVGHRLADHHQGLTCAFTIEAESRAELLLNGCRGQAPIRLFEALIEEKGCSLDGNCAVIW
jgi:hypothetical protein